MKFRVTLNKSELIILINKLKEELSKKCCKKQLSTVSGKE